MKRNLWPARDSVKDYFPLPKEIFSLGLSAAEIAIYAYLLFCEDRQTFQCWPSYRKIGDAVGSVSYTHLDVYKRQARTRLAPENRTLRQRAGALRERQAQKKRACGRISAEGEAASGEAGERPDAFLRPAVHICPQCGQFQMCIRDRRWPAIPSC